MDISHIRVIARLQSSKELNSFSEPRLKINTDVNGPALVVENADNISSERKLNQYKFSRCITNFDLKTEIKDAVNMALDGYDASIIFMSASSTDSYQERQDSIHQLLTILHTRLDAVNQLKDRRGHHQIKIEFAHLGVTDDCCYDLRSQIELKNSQVLEYGLDICMKSIPSAEAIWEKVKFGSKFPSILSIRLSDGSKFLGSLMIADLLHPWSQTLQRNSTSIYFSFNKLNDVVNRISEIPFEGPVPIETFVLTKILGNYVCGLRKTVVLMEFDERPKQPMEATLAALDFSQKLRRVRSTVVRNDVDPRILSYRQQLHQLQRFQEESKQTLIDKLQLEEAVQSLRKQLDRQQGSSDILTQKLQQALKQLDDRGMIIENLEEQMQSFQGTIDEYKKKYNEQELERVTTNFLASASELNRLDLNWEIHEHKVACVKAKYECSKLRGKVKTLQLIIEDLESEKLKAYNEANEVLIANEKKIQEAEDKIRKADSKIQEAEDKALEARKKIQESEKNSHEGAEEKIQEAEKKIQEILASKENMAKDFDQERKMYEERLQKAFNMGSSMQEAKEKEINKEHEKYNKLEEELEYAVAFATQKDTETKSLIAQLENLVHENEKLHEKIKTKSKRDNGVDEYKREAKEYFKQLQEAQKSIEEWKAKAQSAMKQDITVSTNEDEDGAKEQETRSQQRILPTRRAKGKQKMNVIQDFSDDENYSFESKESPIPVEELPKRRSSRQMMKQYKKKPQKQTDVEAISANEEEPETKWTMRKESGSSQEASTKAADKRTSKLRGRPLKHTSPSQVSGLKESESTGAEQSPVLEYQMGLEMPMVVIDGSPIDNEEPENGKQENDVQKSGEQETQDPVVIEEEEALPDNSQKQVEGVQPRKKRKLRNTRREFDYIEDLLSPLSKVNYKLKDS